MKNKLYRYLPALGLVCALGLTQASATEIDISVTSTAATPVTTVYTPFSATMDATTGVHVWLDANTDSTVTDLRATQRELGFREVAYKAALFSKLGNVAAGNTSVTIDPTADQSGITTVAYTGVDTNKKTATTAVGYWVAKDVPIVIGVDGKAYITDGHHTTAGFLASTPATPVDATPGTGVTTNHVVFGHVVASYYGSGLTNEQFWAAMAASNNAYLYGPNGNPLGGVGANAPILPSTTPMPLIPGTTASVGTAMQDDAYRSLTWGMADGVVAGQVIKYNTYTNGTDTSASGTKTGTSGFLKTNSNAVGQPDVNFVEFYYADYLRDRVTWDNTKTGTALGSGQTDANLISAPVGFYAAVANGNALARSEFYKDQNGKNVAEYVGSADANVASWASASVKNGLATTGDKYEMFLLDDSGVNGDIKLSAKSLQNKVHIVTTAGQNIVGQLSNATALEINTATSITTKWGDTAMNSSNSTLAIAAGTGAVTLSGDNDYSRLASLNLSAGSLHIANPNDVALGAAITGNGAFFKEGSKILNLTGNNSGFTGATTVAGGTLKINGAFGGTVTVQSGAILGGSGTLSALATVSAGGHLAPGNSPGTITFSGGLTLNEGTVFDLQLGASASDKILINGGSLSLTPGATGFIVNITDAGDFTAGTYTLIDYSTGATLATAVNAADFHLGSTIAGYDFVISTNGNTLQVTATTSAIPEPSTYAAIVGGLILSVVVIRRRRQA